MHRGCERPVDVPERLARLSVGISLATPTSFGKRGGRARDVDGIAHSDGSRIADDSFPAQPAREININALQGLPFRVLRSERRTTGLVGGFA